MQLYLIYKHSVVGKFCSTSMLHIQRYILFVIVKVRTSKTNVII